MPWYIIYGIFTHKWFLSAVGINTIMQGLRCECARPPPPRAVWGPRCACSRLFPFSGQLRRPPLYLCQWGPQKIKAPTHRPQKKKKEEGKGGFREYCCAAMQGPARAPSSKAAVSRLSGKWGLGLAFMGVHHIRHGRHPISVFFFGQPHLLAPPRLRCTLEQNAPRSRSQKGLTQRTLN